MGSPAGRHRDMPSAVGVPSWDSCVFNSLDACGQAYLDGLIGLAILVTGLWIFRDLLLDALADAWPSLQIRFPRQWSRPAAALPAVLAADQFHDPARVGRLWFGATLNGSDPPPPDPHNVRQGLAAIASHDSSFREDALIDYARRAVPVVLRAWSDRDSRLSHRVMAPLIWEQQKEDIDAYRADGRRNVLEDLTIRQAAIVAASSDARYDTAVVRLRLAAADYDLATQTHALIRGSRTVATWEEDWVFQRLLAGPPPTSGQATCSRCGAPVDLDVAGVCGSCDAELHAPPPPWLLTRIDVVPAQSQPQAA
jgi:predicted lipid-binding transport protein (Tim44 family)